MIDKEDFDYAKTSLISTLQRLIPLNPSEVALIHDVFTPRVYRKRQFILQEGDPCRHLNFVVKGCLRLYKVDDKGNIHILQFASENGWISDLGSFHEHRPSELSIDAIEDTLVLQIKYEQLVGLYTEEPKFNRIFRVLIENSFVLLQKRLLSFISSSAEDRYEAFLQAYPQLSQRLSQKQIASYLGITPEFLSRLRKRNL